MTGRWAIVVGCFYAGLLAVAPAVLGEGDLRVVAEFFLMLAMAEMWNLLAGYAGLVSMGHQVFVGLGAYAVFFAANELNVVPYWALPVAPIFCGVVAAVSALFLFRLRHAYFALGTWVFAEIVAMLVYKTPGLGGVGGIALQTAGLLNFGWFQWVNFWIAGALAGLFVAGCYALLRAKTGLALMAVGDNEVAATCVGIDVWRTRCVAFVLSAAGCGLAGAMSFLGTMFVTTNTAFDLNWVIAMIFIVVVGGIGTLEGPILGTIIYFVLRDIFTDLLTVSGSWYMVVMGLVAVLTMLLAPRGLWPALNGRFRLDWLAVHHRAPTAQRGDGAGHHGIAFDQLIP